MAAFYGIDARREIGFFNARFGTVVAAPAHLELLLVTVALAARADGNN
jgi:hypothetical protein